MSNVWIEFIMDYVRKDTGNLDNRVFKTGERFETDGPVTETVESCGCASGKKRTSYWTITCLGRTYLIDAGFVKDIGVGPFQPQVIPMSVSDRLASIGNPPFDAQGNPLELIEEVRNDRAVPPEGFEKKPTSNNMRQMDAQAVFDLRPRS